MPHLRPRDPNRPVPPRSRSTRFAGAASLLGTLAMLGACQPEGGSAWSFDRFTYLSREWQPWTVTLIDTRTGEALWSVDVPVGRQLTVGFRTGAGPNEYKPDMMQWGFTEAGRAATAMNNQIPVPPAHARRLEPTLRAVPELPDAPASAAARPVEPKPAGAAVPTSLASPPSPAPAPTSDQPEPETTPPSEPPIDLPSGARRPRA